MCLTSAASGLWPAADSLALLGSLADQLLLAASTPEPSTLAWLLSRNWIALSIAAGLGFVIFVHELGHFLVAKACGVQCDKFYIGFDIPMPKIFGWQIPSRLARFRYGETEYGIGILPLGGYVKMLGQDDDPRNAESESSRTKVVSESGEMKLDPRSYPAKPVPARMAIISAGVIMNLIFAVIFGAVAFRFGVPEMPATIGGTMPGSPAWTADIQPGSKVLQFGKPGRKYEYLRWEDLMREVVFNGSDRNLPILVRNSDGQEVWHEIRPSDRLKAIKALHKRPTIGVSPQRTRQIHLRSQEPEFLAPQVTPALAEKDVIVAVEGQRLEADWQLTELLATHPGGPLKVTIARAKKGEDGKELQPEVKEEFEAVIQPRAMRELGLIMKLGPVVAVRENSPASIAGFQVDDEIETLGGQEVGDPLTLGQRMLPGDDPNRTFEVGIRRKDRGKSITKTLVVRPELPQQYQNVYPNGGPAAVESIGLAFDVLNVVAEVVPGSPAEKAGLASGDVVTQYQFVAADEKAAELETTTFKTLLDIDKPLESVTLDNLTSSWTSFISRLQFAAPQTKIKLTWDRNGKSTSGLLEPVAAADWWDESRSLSFYSQKETHIAENWPDAFSLGLRETSERLKEVLRVLSMLATGRLSFTNLSGPPGIFMAAASFASEGIPSLLIFLTLLSANLAIINFLPIPALDGGHMLFLAAEWIRGKPVDERLQIRLTIAGVLCLLSLMVFATVMDIGRFLG